MQQHLGASWQAQMLIRMENNSGISAFSMTGRNCRAAPQWLSSHNLTKSNEVLIAARTFGSHLVHTSSLQSMAEPQPEICTQTLQAAPESIQQTFKHWHTEPGLFTGYCKENNTTLGYCDLIIYYTQKENLEEPYYCSDQKLLSKNCMVEVKTPAICKKPYMYSLYIFLFVCFFPLRIVLSETFEPLNHTEL